MGVTSRKVVNTPLLPVTEDDLISTFDGPVEIVHISQTPKWLRSLDIHHGYRVNHSVSQCITSLFSLHNETVNVWSHLVPGIVFIYLGVYEAHSAFWELENHKFRDAIILSIFLFSTSACMFFSAAYHLFCCVSESLFYKLRGLDFFGIFFACGGSFLSGTHFVFMCDEKLRDFYTTVLVLSLALAVISMRMPIFHSHRFKWIRILIFAVACGAGVVPTLHFLYVHNFDFANSPELQFYIPPIILCYSCYAIGMAWYISRFPECCAPGRFDYFFASHQFWHLWVVMGAIFWYHSILAYRQHREDTGCATYGVLLSGDEEE
eukprot:Rmarinus@m.29315